MSPHPWLELPPELWAHVTQYWSPPTLKALALVSRICRAEARKTLYRNVTYGSGCVPRGETRIGDLTLFGQTLLTWAGWRSAVRYVRFRWNHGNRHAWDDLPEDITDADRQRDEQIGQVAAMLRLNRVVPVDCHRPGTSNVTRLTFTDCGPVSEEIADVLRWPKDLRVLRFSVAVADGLNRYAYDSGNGGLTMAKILRTVRAVEGSLRDLSIGILHMEAFLDPEPLQKEAFRSFSKLRRLEIPLAMLTQFSDEEDSPAHKDTEPPIHTRLPFALEELVLHVEVDLPWFQILDDEEETCVPSAEARELFAWLSGLAEHRSNCFPHLVEVRIVRNDRDWLTPETHPYDFPLDCEHTRQLAGLLESVAYQCFLRDCIETWVWIRRQVWIGNVLIKLLGCGGSRADGEQTSYQPSILAVVLNLTNSSSRNGFRLPSVEQVPLKISFSRNAHQVRRSYPLGVIANSAMALQIHWAADVVGYMKMEPEALILYVKVWRLLNRPFY